MTSGSSAATLAVAERAPVTRVALRTLAVRDFRNLERLDLELPADGVAIVGENGQGKSNLLEAIYYLHLLRSVRGARDLELVRFGAAGFHVAATTRDGLGVSAGFARQGKKKRVLRDGAEPARLTDALGAIPSVLFSPADVTLVAGSPTERRRYLDIILALTSRHYLAALQKYRSALASRNAALRDALKRTRGDASIAVWDEPIAQHGAVLWMERLAWVTAQRERFAAIVAAIGERSAVTMRYVASQEPPASLEEARDAIAQALEQQRFLDRKRGITHAGPHRHDVGLSLDGRDLRTYGSAGQQRTAAIALRVLEVETFRDRRGAAPLFLLDDPFAELDARRAARIVALLADAGLGQIVLTVPRAQDIPAELTGLARWGIANGRVDSGDGLEGA